MAKTNQANGAQGAEVATVNNEAKEKAIAKFSSQSNNFLTAKEAEAVFQTGIFEEDGVDVTNKILTLEEFWNDRKGEEIKFIACSIVQEEGKNGVYDLVTGVAQTVDGERLNCAIPQAVVTDSIKKTGLGAYKIVFNGMKKGRENTYADFKITMQKLFNQN